MTQLTFSDAGYAGKRKRARREAFLAEMNQMVPWDALLALIEPHCPIPEGAFQGLGQEHRADGHLVRAVEPVDGAWTIVGDGRVIAPAGRQIRSDVVKRRRKHGATLLKSCNS